MAVMSYATVGSNRLEGAKAFYDALLGGVGMTPMFEHPSGGRVYGREGTINFAVLGPFDRAPATVGNGAMFAFGCDTRAEVDAFHAHALQLGGTDEGAPGARGPDWYFCYVRDLDGNKLCAFCMG
ncbi:VOC family protein [Sphingobium aquiterrae]|uniref:VOC family protein n=1 Tax=Sphingobium aquiterrae TaxID=2038656 RepID=UPI003018DD53